MLRHLLPLLPFVVLALPAAATAATATSTDGRIHVAAAPGETNAVRITREDIALPVGVWENGAGAPPLTVGAGCFVGSSVQCGGGSPVVELGDGDDSLTYLDDTTSALIGPAKVDGGPGDDTITTAMSDDEVDGGAGADTVDGFVGDDTLVGGPGADTLDGSFGDDRMDARDGAGSDVVRCGEGVDVVDADLTDTVHPDCEDVRRPQTADEPVITPPAPDAPGAPSAPAAPMAPAGVAAPAPGPVNPRVVTDPPRGVRDTRAPVLTVRRAGRALTLRCDEACTVRVVAGRTKLTRRLAGGRAVKVRVGGRARRATITATDAAGNRMAARRTLAAVERR